MIMYRATALQLTLDPINVAKSKAEARAMMMAAIDRVATTMSYLGTETRLVVLPEYYLTNFPMGIPMDQWADWAALDFEGPEHDALAAIAQKHKCFLCFNAYEKDTNFPESYFQSNVIFNPSGDIILRYRRLNSLHTPTPHDYWDKFLDLYGMDGVYPVAKTEIGNLCMIASEEIQYPELVRSFAVRGAEVFCHPSAEALDLAVSAKDIAKRARAIENMGYVVSANVGGARNVPYLESSTDGLSKVVDYEGRVLAEAGQGESIAASADLNISALRRFRNRPGMNNFFSRHRMELYWNTYSRTEFYPPNLLVDKAPSRQLILSTQSQVLARLRSAGIIEPDEE
jgi:predicted amidohydrolase